MNHIAVQAVWHRTSFGGGAHHALVDEPQLVHTSNHHVRLHALPVAADEIVVERRIHVLQRLDPRERLVRVDEVHVERVLRQLHLRFAHHGGTVDQRVHENVFGQPEMPQIVPREAPAGLHGMTEVHDVLVALAHLVIHIVGDEHVERLVLIDLAAQHGHDLFERFRADPIVRVHDLHVHAARRRDAGVDRAAVALVLLMDRAHDSRIARLERLRHLQRAVGRAVIHDQHFDVVVALRRDQRFDAPFQVFRHVVRGHHEGERLLLLHILPRIGLVSGRAAGRPLRPKA